MILFFCGVPQYPQYLYGGSLKKKEYPQLIHVSIGFAMKYETNKLRDCPH